jgi:tetratricopeptide (TPR) repeat protein
MEDLAEIRESLKKDPNNPRALKAAGNYYLTEGFYKQAKDLYTQAFCLSPHLLPEIILDYEREIETNPEKIGLRFSLAGFHLARGQIDSSMLELEESLEIYPKNVEAYNILGKIFVKQERIDETITLIEKSLQEGIKDVSLIEILAGAYLEKGRINEAVKFYEEILIYRPGDKHILRVLGELYTRTENYIQAAESYRAMFSDDPEVSREVIQRLESLLKKLEGNVLIREILAEIYMRSLNPEAAVAKLREILRLDAAKSEEVVSRLKAVLKSYPLHPQATLALGEVLRRQGNFSEAIENYYNLVKTKPEFLEEAIHGYQEVLEFCPEQVLARAYLAEAFLYKNQVKEALHEFEHMLEADPGTAETVVRKCREIIKSHPQLLLARVVLGRAYLAKGDVQRAAMEAEGVTAVDKKFTSAYLLLGEAYSKLSLGRKAAEVLRMALSIEPFNSRVQERYRQVKEREADLEIEKTKEKIVEDPWRISLHLDLAKLYTQKGLREEAIRELQVSLKDQSRAPFASNLLGCMHRGEGRFDLAAAQFNRALELTPPELSDVIRNVRFNLGTTQEAHGMVRKALKAYESILQEDIDFGNLRKRVKYLKATSLQSMRTKSLLMLNGGPGEIIALWGREGKTGRGGTGRKEEMSVSFGQNHNAAGFEYFMKGMYKAALEEFQLAVQLDIKFAAALNNLSVSLVKEKSLAEARTRLEDTVNIEPNSMIFRNNLGVIYFMLGQLNNAEIELNKAYAIDPENTAVCINLGDICYLKKDVKRAIELYKQVGSFDVLTEVAEQRLMYKTPD